MPSIDPVTAVAEAIKEIASAIKMLFNGNNRKLLADIKRVKNMQKALNKAEECFKESDLCVPKENKKYWRARENFSKFD